MITFPSWFWPAICAWLVAFGFAVAAFAIWLPRTRRLADPTSFPAAPEEGTR